MEPLTTPSPGHEICNECEGKRTCWSCFGAGKRANGAACGECGGNGLCAVCHGDGERKVGAATRSEARPAPEAIPVRWFHEFGHDTA